MGRAEPDRRRASTGSSATRGGPQQPATLEGRIVRLVDRIAYINHDIDDAVRAGVIAPADLPREPIAILGETGSERIDTLVHDLVEHSAAAGDIVQGDEIGGAMAALRAFMFERVYLGPEATREHAKIDLVIRTLFEHFCSHPDEIPDSIPDGEYRSTSHRPPRRDDRSLLSGAVRGADRSGRVRAVSRYTADSRDRVRDAVDMVALVVLARSSCAARVSTATSAAVRSTTSAPRRSTSAPTRSTTTASAARSRATRSTS